MTRYILRRLVIMIPVAFLASVMLFLLLKLTPGDPVLIMLGEQATAQNYAALRHDLGLDQPYPVQYARWVSHVMEGDFGKSIRNGAPVKDEILSRLPATLQLGVAALVLSLMIALPLGILSAVFRRTPLGFVATAFSQVGVAIPGFFVGLVFIYVFALSLRWFPPGSYTAFS
ncbi:MAG: ABC transporter permease, partial [Chloroflexi bacterium]|nr:ABC transporter permease [Chloroflexota bacterium]